MNDIIIHSHSGLRWIILILLIVTIINAFRKWKSGKEFLSIDGKLSLYTLILAHIQLLLGLYLFFTSSKVMLSGLDMSNKAFRFFTLTYPWNAYRNSTYNCRKVSSQKNDLWTSEA